MFENNRRGRQARNFTTNVPKILNLKSSSEQIYSENCRWVPLKHHHQQFKKKFISNICCKAHGTWMEVNEMKGKSSSIVHEVCLPTKRLAIWGLGLSFSVLKSFNTQSEGFSQGLLNNLKWSKVELSLSSLKRDANVDSKPTRTAITRALRKTRPCSASHHLSKNAQKMANDWLIIHQSLWKQKTKKHQGGEGNGLNPAAIFTGGYGRFREFGGCRTRAVTGGSGANGLRTFLCTTASLMCNNFFNHFYTI